MSYAKPLACPEDGGAFKETMTKFGVRRECETCTVVQWCDENGKPKGTPANIFLRTYRKRAHASFDQLWKTGLMKRGEAYRWLMQAMKRQKPVHMAQMTVLECDEVVRLSEKKLKELKT